MDGSGRTAAIVTQGLTRDFGGGHGIFDLDLEVLAGEVFGFIGPNGAGKTTTIRLLMDLARPDRGRATVLGLDAHAQSVQLKRHIGYLPGELPLYPRATGAQIIGLLASMRGGVDNKRIVELAGRLQVELHRPYKDLSHGNKQKIWLVQAFMHDPKLLVLDEPTLGLDPLIQAEFHQMLVEATRAGATVFLSSHVLSEVQTLCSRIGLVSEGRLVRVGTLESLRDVRLHRLDAKYSRDIDRDRLSRLAGLSDLVVEDHHLRCTVRGDVAPLLAALADAGAVEIDSEELSLEEIFLATYRKPAA